MPGSECVPVLLAALGRITGTDTGADGDDAEMVAIAPTTLWSLTADRHRPGSLAQSVERLGLAATRGARPDVQRHLDGAGRRRARGAASVRARRPIRRPRGRRYLAAAHSQTLAGMLALSGVAAESMVQDVGWTDDGHRQAHRARASG